MRIYQSWECERSFPRYQASLPLPHTCTYNTYCLPYDGVGIQNIYQHNHVPLLRNEYHLHSSVVCSCLVSLGPQQVNNKQKGFRQIHFNSVTTSRDCLFVFCFILFKSFKLLGSQIMPGNKKNYRKTFIKILIVSQNEILCHIQDLLNKNYEIIHQNCDLLIRITIY